MTDSRLAQLPRCSRSSCAGQGRDGRAQRNRTELVGQAHAHRRGPAHRRRRTRAGEPERQAEPGLADPLRRGKQRAQLARALAQEPLEILLDEPTSHLDIRNQLELLELLRSLGITCILALHDLAMAARYCDHIVLLDQGRVIAAGPPQDIVTPELISKVYGVDVLVDHEPSTGIVRVTYIAPARGSRYRQLPPQPGRLP
jgi:hypothetical protein